MTATTARQHPSFEAVAAACRRHPAQAAALFQTFADLTHSQGWRDLRVLELAGTDLCVLKGKAKAQNGAIEEKIVLPMVLTTPTHMQTLQGVFAALPSREESILVSIADSDSTTVYYKLGNGIVKPKEVPD
ncbi:uncharacterized protein L969DRAFT_93762 [Mixia osmundae IAM 14324]|uniref:tRNA-splicing endonuclease subunit Sen15 domain-containing protein n=1 Tax=Mixia osmundae (strain CBS 9802 / IAM 14324 / JCM 22182 / KY 12970) TaxID=764103 RepID=G7E9I0_MIXOS|nr:uncharacterized protein L969DRAFT_93762 [Mixia osmundae IAM 14324]KEI39931.1 hypothetical protein L969DRAFT_93762 [Mixia osmundae IAM 14324]GAA99299.1 hypothetical protein E5Q_05994 [Mixia osmundae IAM 14324]